MRLHSEDSGLFAPEISGSACHTVAGFWKTVYRAQAFSVMGAHLLALDKLTPTTKDPGRGVWGRGQSAPQQGIFKGTAVPLNDLLLPFLAFRKGRPLGVRGHGPNGPRRRDLRGPIEIKAMKRKASKIILPLGQGEKLSDR